MPDQQLIPARPGLTPAQVEQRAEIMEILRQCATTPQAQALVDEFALAEQCRFGEPRRLQHLLAKLLDLDGWFFVVVRIMAGWATDTDPKRQRQFVEFLYKYQVPAQAPQTLDPDQDRDEQIRRDKTMRDLERRMKGVEG